MNITVYCGSKIGSNPEFKLGAELLGTWIGQGGHTMIYGGATNGLMGITANACLNAGGQVIGIVPKDLEFLENWHTGLSQLIEVDTLPQRKLLMTDQGDAYIALPGGPGTLEEIIEMISWARVGFHQKPCILFNIDGYYNPLKQVLEQMVSQAFIQEQDLQQVHFVQNLPEIEDLLKNYILSS